MYVPSYQMHNVLNVYAKKLERHGTARRPDAPAAPPSDTIRLTAEGKRQAVVAIPSRGRPRNHGVKVDGRIVVVPCGNLRTRPPGT